MLSLLLDENISPEIANQIVEKRPDIPVISIYHWHNGDYLKRPDDVVLMAAKQESLTLFTYDQKTIPPLLVQWGQSGTEHAGVVFVDYRSISNNDFGAIIRAIIVLYDTNQVDDWTNMVAFLRPAR